VLLFFASQVTGYCNNDNPPGFYAVLYYNPKDDSFNILSNPKIHYSATTTFSVFTTTGTLSSASTTVKSYTTYTATVIDGTAPANIVNDVTSWYSRVIYTDLGIDCEFNKDARRTCIKKGDYIMIVDTDPTSTKNPRYPNIYQVMKISKEPLEHTGGVENIRYQIVVDVGLNARYEQVGAGANTVRIFKFTPPATPVTYAAECSNRGICDTTTGVCGCFSGYTGDDCSVMNALAQQ